MDKEETATTSASGAAGSGEAKKKIAGKYDSAEHGIESLDKGFTEGFHAMKEELGAVRQMLERALTSDAGTTEVGTRGREDQGYTRGKSGDDDEFDQVGFLSAPGKVLKEREGKQEARIVKALETRVANMITNASIVSRFQAKNSDLDEHEELVTMFMSKTDPRKELGSQLNEAAKLTRAYLKKMKGDSGSAEGDDGRTTSNEEFEEGPTGRRAEGETSTERGKDKVQTKDEVLAENIKEHKAFKSSRFMPKATK